MALFAQRIQFKLNVFLIFDSHKRFLGLTSMCFSGKTKEKNVKRSSSGSSSKENNNKKSSQKRDDKKRKAAAYDVRKQYGYKTNK